MNSNTVPDKVSARITSINDVLAEREAQDAKWGEQNHPDGTGPDRHLMNYWPLSTSQLCKAARNRTDWAAKMGVVTFADILLEEVFEALAEDDPSALREELVQVAAVAVQWVEAIDRRTEAGL